MNNNLRKRLIIVFLINLFFLSFLYYLQSIRIKNLEDSSETDDSTDYNFDDLYFLGTSNRGIYIYSFEDSQKIEVTDFLEKILKQNEELFIIASFNVIYITFELCVLIQNLFINKKSRENTSLEIEGVRVIGVERKIFNLIQEFLSQNRVFTEEKVISYVKSRSKTNGNLNYNGIKSVVASLIKKNLVVEGSKLTRKTVLVNSNRQLIYNAIKEHPGIYMNKLSKLLELSPFVIDWHLSILLKFQLIRIYQFDNNISYFDSTLTKENDDIFHIISKEKCSKIIRYLSKCNKGCTKNQVSKKLHMHYNTIRKYMNELDNFDLLVKKIVNNLEYIYLNKVNFKKLIKE